MTAPQPPLRVAVLGLGFMGSMHLKGLAGTAGAQLTAVFDFDEARLSGDLSSVQGNIGGPGGKLDFKDVKKYRDLDALLADPSIDAIDVCLPTDLHHAVTIAALRAGKHVLVEKPMALDAKTAGEMVDEAESRKRVLMTAHVLRFWPEYVALREAVRGRTWGALRFVDLRRRCAAPGWGGWLRDPSRSGGAILDLLVHDIDVCVNLLGVPGAVSATGATDPSGLNWIDARFTWSTGEAARVAGGWLHPGAFPFSMEFLAAFEGATMDFSSDGRPLTICKNGGGTAEYHREDRDGYAAEIQYFVECCREHRAPEICPPRESAAAVQLAHLMLESRERKGETIACRI